MKKLFKVVGQPTWIPHYSSAFQKIGASNTCSHHTSTETQLYTAGQTSFSGMVLCLAKFPTLGIPLKIFGPVIHSTILNTRLAILKRSKKRSPVSNMMNCPS